MIIHQVPFPFVDPPLYEPLHSHPGCGGSRHYGKITQGDTNTSVEIMPQGKKKINPRYQNGNLRRKHRARFQAMDAPCGICKGKLGPIHYDEPSDSAHPLSFVIDEIKPMSRWKEFGYPSAAAACNDWNNLQAAHYCCNASKGNRMQQDKIVVRIQQKIVQDGQW